MTTTSTAELGPPRRRRIYLMRHGEVSYFDATGKPYVPTTVPLNEAGKEQARAAAQALAEIRFDRVVASDLPRSIETATIVSAGRQPIESHAELREIQPGRLTDIPAERAQEAFVNAFSRDLSRTERFLGGETYGSLEDRVNGFFDSLLAEKNWQCLLIVAHGGVNRVILGRALGLTLSQFGAFEQDPCGISVLDVDDDQSWIIRLVNHTPYNPAKRGMELTTMEQVYLQYLGRC